MKNRKSLGLASKIFIAMVCGIVLGVILYGLPSGYIKDEILIDGVFKFIGDIFIRLLRMMLVPLVFTSLATGAASMGEVGRFGRIGIKIMAFYLLTTAFAIVTALIIANLINPGFGLDMSAILKTEATISPPVPLVEVLSNIIPKNPIEAMVNENMLQVISFAILFGLALSILQEKAEKVKIAVGQLNEVFLKIIAITMNFAPIGVFALVTNTFASLGYKAMMPLTKYVICVILGLLTQGIVVYGGLLTLLGRVNPLRFYKKMLPVISIGFSTASSMATLPIALRTSEYSLGVSNRICSFTIPLGATVNMDGTAIMQGVAIIFIAQVYGVPLDLSSYFTVILTATLASIGTAGVPSGALIMLSLILTSVGLPIEGISLIIGIDRLVDMCRTPINLIGDQVCTLIVAKQEREFDEEVFLSDVKI